MTKINTYRYLAQSIQEIALNRHKMVFISGPRQVGKTTFSKSYAHLFKNFSYKNWDDVAFKKWWSKNDFSELLQELNHNETHSSKLVIFDEIHKAKGWKSKLKGFYDLWGDITGIIVTGSARLNVYKKGSDSLMGRYYHFRLHPFSLCELAKLEINTPQMLEKKLFTKTAPRIQTSFSALSDLFVFSGFPEPLFAKNSKIQRLWKNNRLHKIVREDLLDLSQVQEISSVEILCSLLPERVGSTVSVQSLREILNVSHESVSRWLTYLQELYYIFEIKPYSKSISRSLKKEGKLYLYDWTECETDGAKFENMIASHLLKLCHFYEDTGEGDFKLNYLRDKDKNEIDFIIIKDKKPWFTVECKFSDQTLHKSYIKFQNQLQCPHIQVVYGKNIFRKIDDLTWIMSADYFCEALV
jgi:predicted AAA+ superfamily ATPase